MRKRPIAFLVIFGIYLIAYIVLAFAAVGAGMACGDALHPGSCVEEVRHLEFLVELLGVPIVFGYQKAVEAFPTLMRLPWMFIPLILVNAWLIAHFMSKIFCKAVAKKDKTQDI